MQIHVKETFSEHRLRSRNHVAEMPLQYLHFPALEKMAEIVSERKSYVRTDEVVTCHNLVQGVNVNAIINGRQQRNENFSCCLLSFFCGGIMRIFPRLHFLLLSLAIERIEDTCKIPVNNLNSYGIIKSLTNQKAPYLLHHLNGAEVCVIFAQSTISLCVFPNFALSRCYSVHIYFTTVKA